VDLRSLGLAVLRIFDAPRRLLTHALSMLGPAAAMVAVAITMLLPATLVYAVLRAVRGAEKPVRRVIEALWIALAIAALLTMV